MEFKIALIGTDTPHRRFIINKLFQLGFPIKLCIFQKSSLLPKFNTKPNWFSQEYNALNDAFSSINLTLNNESAVHYVDTLNSIKVINKLENENINLFIVSGAGIIKNELLKLISLNALNVHMGNAHEYRGLDTNLWAIYHKDFRNVGVTVHALDKTLDTGDVYRYSRLKLKEDTPIWMLRYYESIIAIEILKDACIEKANGTIKLVKQKSIGRYYSFMPGAIKDILPQILKAKDFN